MIISTPVKIGVKGIQRLTIALYDKRKRRIDELGYTCTDKKGYFRLIVSQRDDDKDRPTTSDRRKQGPEAFIHVLDKKGRSLYTGTEPLIPEPGRVDYREIIMRDDEGETCTPPPDSTQPEPQPEAPSPQPTILKKTKAAKGKKTGVRKRRTKKE